MIFSGSLSPDTFTRKVSSLYVYFDFMAVLFISPAEISPPNKIPIFFHVFAFYGFHDSKGWAVWVAAACLISLVSLVLSPNFESPRFLPLNLIN